MMTEEKKIISGLAGTTEESVIFLMLESVFIPLVSAASVGACFSLLFELSGSLILNSQLV